MKNMSIKTTPTPQSCSTWFVVFLYLSSLGMLFFVLFEIYTSLEG